VESSRTIGRTGEHRKVELEDEDGNAVSAFWWHSSGLPVPEGRFDLAYVLRINRFRGELSLQLEWVDARGGQAVPVELPPTVAIPEVADYRGLAEPLPVLHALWQEGQMQVWAEAVDPPSLRAVSRAQLADTSALAIWTAPPAAQVLAQALASARPEQVYLFDVDPALDTPRQFMRRLSGLVKYALEVHGGRLMWDSLAAATAHRTDTVRVGVEWLISLGQLALVSRDPDGMQVAEGGQDDPEASHELQARLEDLLRETAAYRRYYRETDARLVLSVGG
jgi:hypothetical protein